MSAFDPKRTFAELPAKSLPEYRSDPLLCPSRTWGEAMRRRDFITLLGSASAWSLSARAQQPAMPVVGWLSSIASDPFGMSLFSAFRAGLKDAGYVEGQNVAIDFRWAAGQYSLLPTLAAELIAKRVDVIVAGGPPGALAAKAATQTIPIFSRPARIRSGWVLSPA